MIPIKPPKIMLRTGLQLLFIRRNLPQASFLKTSSSSTSRLSSSSTVKYIDLSQKDGEFYQMYPKVVEISNQLEYPQYITSHTIEDKKTSMDYNLLDGGKRSRAQLFMDVYLACGGQNIESAMMIAWAIESLQSSFLVSDDLVDQSPTRRGKESWYKMVGNKSVNDSCVLQQLAFRLVNEAVTDDSLRAKMMTELSETIYMVSLGQNLDHMASVKAHMKDMTQHMDSGWEAQVFLKTTSYTTMLPTRLGLLLNGITDQRIILLSDIISRSLGKLFQGQDDYLDVFGDEKVTGKKGTDLKEGKCAWPLVTAIMHASVQQMLLIRESIGKDYGTATLFNVIKENHVPKLWKEWEENQVTIVKDSIVEVTKETNGLIPSEPFFRFLNKIYKRDL